MAMQTDKRLSVLELAERLQIPKNSVYRYLRSGKIPCQRIGRRYLIFASTIEDWRRPPLPGVREALQQ